MRPVYDKATICQVLRHGEVFPFIGDSGTSPDWEPVLVEHVYYLMPQSNDACFMVHPHSRLVWEIHAAVLPESRKQSLRFMREAIQWVREHLPAKCLVAYVPQGNYRALALAKAVGGKITGFLPRSWQRDGSYVGQHMLTKEL